MKISPQGIEFIKWLQKVQFDKAIKWHLHHISIYEKTVNNLITVPLNQNQFDALVSICISVKPAQFRRSRLVRYINSGYHLQFIIDEIRRLNKPFRITKIDWRLVERRKKEIQYFLGYTEFNK